MSTFMFTNPSATADGLPLVKPGVLRVATVGSPPPFTFAGQFKHYPLDGMEIRLVDEVSRRLGLTYEPVVLDLGGMIPGLLQGSFDSCSTSMDITEERKKQVDFVSWLTYDVCVVGRKDAPEGQNAKTNYAHLKVGVEVSSSFIPLAENCGFGEIVLYKMPSDFLLGLEQGQVDVVLLPRMVADYVIHVKKLPFVVLDPVTTLEAGWPFKKDNSQLRDAVKQALDEMKADGTYQKIINEVTRPASQ